MTSNLEKTIPVYNMNHTELSLCTAKRAQRLVSQGRAEYYNDGIVLLVKVRNTSVKSKRNLYKNAKGRCYICDTPITFSDMTVDHIFPLSSSRKPMVKNKRFIFSFLNKRCCCEKCNVDKGSLTLIKYCSKIEKDRNNYPLITNEKLSYLMNLAKEINSSVMEENDDRFTAK